MLPGEQYLKNLDEELRTATGKLREEIQAIRGSRPSVELVQDLKVNVYDQPLTVQQVGSLSVVPPRSIHVSVWDKNAVGAVVKAIEDAKIGLSVSNDGNNVIATISPLVSERREELLKLAKKIGEGARIGVRTMRDDVMKKIKDVEARKELGEDEAFKAKEKAQKIVDGANAEIEKIVSQKIKELSE